MSQPMVAEIEEPDDATLARHYRSLFQQAAVGMHRMDYTGRYIEVNDRLCVIFGASRETILDSTYLDFIHPDDLSFLTERITTIIDGKSDDYSVIVRIVRWSDKMPRWVRVTGSMTNDIETYLFCIVEDIHEEKMIAERQKLLLNELNHRVKNTLATVQSLAMNTMKLSDPTAFYLDFEARLLALSHAHNLLTREEWIGVSFKELVELPLTTFAGKRYHAEGPEIELKPNAAVTLSMVFHELATNAAKYGSLSESEGKVILEWIVNKESGNKFLDIFWREIDGPEVSLPTRRGFGSRLIEVAAPREFSGGAKITYPKTGVQCHFRIPLSGIVISE